MPWSFWLAPVITWVLCFSPFCIGIDKDLLSEGFPLWRFPLWRFPLWRFPLWRFPLWRFPLWRFPLWRFPLWRFPLWRFPLWHFHGIPDGRGHAANR